MRKPSVNGSATRPPEAPAGALESLMTIADLCRFLVCDRRTVERMRSAGRLPRPALQIGRSPRWCPEAIRAWVERGGRQ